MQQRTVEAPRRGDPPQGSEPWETLNCKYCGSSYVSRIFREGLLQERVYPLFGFYPWKCKTCLETQMFRRRDKSASKKLADGRRPS